MRHDFYWFRVHDHIDEHPKIEPLSDGAFRLLVETWAYCRRTGNDGRISDSVWRKRGTPKARRELAAAGLIEQLDGQVQVHDYLDWQQSAAEVDDARAKKSRAGDLGNHTRWHVRQGLIDPACSYCSGTSPDDSNGSHLRSQVRQQPGSHTGRTRVAEVEGEGEVGGYVEEGGYGPDARATPPTFPDRCRRHAHVAEPGPCGACADVRKANATRPTLTLVTDALPCLVHAQPDVRFCRGCAADAKAASS